MIRQHGEDVFLMRWITLASVLLSDNVLQCNYGMFCCRSVKSVWWIWPAVRGPTRLEPKGPGWRWSIRLFLLVWTHTLIMCVCLMLKQLISVLISVSQEGANINKSLTTLGKVISALAEVVCIISACYYNIRQMLWRINMFILLSSSF